MQKGDEQSVVFAVLGILVVVGIFALTTLLLKSPSGQLTQGESWYPVANLPSDCSGNLIYLRSEGNANIYCCDNQMNGMNNCKEPYVIIMT